MTTNIYSIIRIGEGSLSIMAKPTQPDPSAAFKAICDAGTTHLVSLLEHSEADALGLADEALWCANHSLTFLQYPIGDFSVPTQPKHFSDFTKELHALIAKGAHVVIHCRGGIGRSGLAASSVMLFEGYKADTAMASVSATRAETTPETDAQVAFIRQMEALVAIANE